MLDVPLRTRVPIKATQCLSDRPFPPPSPCASSPSPSEQISAFFLAGLVSPVKADSSISRETAEIIRISAGIRSPTEKVTRSPGTSVLARGEMGRPLLQISFDHGPLGDRDLPYEMAVMWDKLDNELRLLSQG